MRRLIPIIAALALLALLPGCRNERWHQKLTVIVETPNGEVSGSSVTEVTTKDTRYWFVPPEAKRVTFYLRGEAVALEVTPGKWLFALLDGREDGKGSTKGLAYAAFGLSRKEGGGFYSYEEAMAKLRAQPLDTPALIPTTDYPLMVTFDDIDDPASVKRVDPLDLAASFGPGVSLKAVTLEITREPVTEGRVEGVLGWLCDHITNYRRLSGQTGPIFTNDLSNRIGPGAFKIGECK